MRLVLAGCLVILFAACAPATVEMPTSALTPSGALPDTIDCDRPVVVNAGNTPQGIRAERDWLTAHYPNHGPYGQKLRHGPGGRSFDILTFNASDGRTISVCFDITSFFGKW